MPQPQFSVPPSVTQHIARAKAAIKRGDALKAVQSLMTVMELFEPQNIIGKAKYETEILLAEVVDDLNRNSNIEQFLHKIAKDSHDTRIRYHPGQEERLTEVLPLLLKVLQEDADKQERHLSENREARRDQLWEKGTTLLGKVETMPRGKAVLRRLAEEFPDEPGLQAKIGEALVRAKLAPEAVEFLEAAVRRAPGEHKSYGYLVRAYTELRRFEDAEKIYIQALKRFGQHYKTLINFAKLYKLWNKRDDAYDIARMALREAPGNAEAQALLDWADRRR